MFKNSKNRERINKIIAFIVVITMVGATVVSAIVPLAGALIQ